MDKRTVNLRVTLRPLRENKILCIPCILCATNNLCACPKICPSVLLSKNCVFCALCVRIKILCIPCILCAPKKYVLLFFCQKKLCVPLRTLILCPLCEQINFCVSLWFLCETLPCGMRTHEPCTAVPKKY